jgi:hypothetical protein
MARLFLVVLTLGMFTAVLAGCHADAGIDVDSTAQIAR